MRAKRRKQQSLWVRQKRGGLPVAALKPALKPLAKAAIGFIAPVILKAIMRKVKGPSKKQQNDEFVYVNPVKKKKAPKRPPPPQRKKHKYITI